MASTIEQLSVTLTAKIDEFQSNLRQAGNDFDRQATQIEDRNSRLTANLNSQMQNVGAGVQFLATTIKGLFTFAAVEAFISAMDKARDSLVTLSRQADDTRLSVEQLAAIKFEGAGFGVGTDEINKALSFFTEQSKKTTDDARGLYAALNQIGPAFKQAFIDAPSQADRLETISRALKATSDETKRAQLAQNAFGTDNERVIASIDGINGSLDSLVERAKAAGISVDTDLAQKADDAAKKLATLREVLGDKLTVALANVADIISNQLGPAFASLLPFIQTTLREINAIVTAFNTLSGAVSLFAATGHIPMPGAAAAYARTAGYDEPGAIRDEHELTVHPDRNRPAFGPRANLQKKPEAASTDEFDREEESIKKSTRANIAHAAALKEVGENAAKAEAQSRLYQAAQEAGKTITPALKLEIDRLSDAYAKAKNQLDGLKLSQDLVFERAQIGRSVDEQAVYSRLRGAHQDPDSDEGKRLADQIRDIQRLTEGKEMASSFVKGLVSDMENGVKVGRALENQLKRILEKLADKSIDSIISSLFGAFGGSGSGSGIFGAFSGLFTSAAAHSQGGWAGTGPQIMVPRAAFRGAQKFAEGGGIPAILHAGEIVLNQAQQKNVAKAITGPPVSITHSPVINGAGLSAEQLAVILDRNNKAFARQIGPTLNDWQRRHG